MRLFIAINFDSEAKNRFVEAQDRLREMTRGGNYTRRENMHLTLIFLGETPPDRVSDIRRAMEETPVSELTLTFDRAGCFHRGGGDIWWAGLADNPGLVGTRRELAYRLKARGFHFDAGQFTPHITLAREVKTPGGGDAANILPESFETHADKISLMLSERIHGILRYTELFYR